jgi:hypothetical protein
MFRNLTRSVYVGSHGVKNGQIMVSEMKLVEAQCEVVRGMKVDQGPKHCQSLVSDKALGSGT